jgi:hypothetical protein
MEDIATVGWWKSQVRAGNQSSINSANSIATQLWGKCTNGENFHPNVLILLAVKCLPPFPMISPVAGITLLRFSRR